MQEEPREAERHSCKSEGGQQEQGSGERGHDSPEGVLHRRAEVGPVHRCEEHGKR